jgi:hypothetical protein
VNLNPDGSPDSEARGVFGGQQVGYAQVGDAPHAALWSGTAASWVDLHAFLPAGFSESIAQSIWSDATHSHVAGYAYNGDHQQAVLWTQPVPEPRGLTLLAMVLARFTSRRRTAFRGGAGCDSKEVTNVQANQVQASHLGIGGCGGAGRGCPM